MVAVNTVLYLAILTTSTRIESSQERHGDDLIGRRFVLVLEATLVSFRTRASQVMVIAEFVAVFPLFYVVQRRLRHLDRRIESSEPRVPWWWQRLAGLSGLSWSTGGFGLKRNRKSHLGWRARTLDGTCI